MKPKLFLCSLMIATQISTGVVFGAEEQSQKKNIVVLLADDLGWGDVGFHGSEIETPNIDSLARDGVRLDRFYAYPACSPARAAMLTGRFPQRYGISGPVRPRDEGLPTTELLLPEVFQKAGYATSLIGKWHLGMSGKDAHPIRRGFDQFYGFMEASIDYYSHSTERGRPDWQRDGRPLDETGYSTDLLADEAVRQIAGRKSGQPFCIVVAFNAPHSPFQAPDELIGKYAEKLSGRAATYAAMVDSMDRGIGRILSVIDESGLRDETIVVFASDNGAARLGTNAPLRGQKRQVYEGGIHVPCVIRAPGQLEAGTISQQLFAIHDLFPTLAQACGVAVDAPNPLDGQPLWRQLTGATATPRTLVIAEADHAIIRDNWKLIEFANGKTELFNLATDPHETTNVADSDQRVAAGMLAGLTHYKAIVQTDGTFRNTGRTFAATRTDSIDQTGSVSDGLQEGESLANATVSGDATYGVLGDRRVESNGHGIRLMSGSDMDGSKSIAGEASIMSTAVTPDQRWYRFYVSGLAQDEFVVDRDDLYLKVEFFQKNGTDSLDYIKERIYPQVVRERENLIDKDTNESLGHATWRTYAMNFRTPFAEVDAVKLSIGFTNGKGADSSSEFWVSSMDVKPMDAPPEYSAAHPAVHDFPQPDESMLVALGGRWYFNPRDASADVPKTFNYTNAEQLLYRTDRYEAPFAGNMSSWLRAGYLNLSGDEVTKDEYRPNAVTVSFTDRHLVMHSCNLPNHPTATFPDRWRMLDGNPSYIKEQDNTWHIPLDPKRNPEAIAMDASNSNQALPMGAIGVATNGVIFFNPFDHIFETDAVWRLDRCCGHPSPRQQYHYHKYPVCVKTPWSDEGKAHSSLIGFAFDGYPVYGPYESAGLLAKDDTVNPLNEFNLHEDSARGPHYHVTPGEFPHIIGGYWGQVESRNRRGGRSQ